MILSAFEFKSIQRESVHSRPWTSPGPPASILVIRLHAVGDVAITLPLCASVRGAFPFSRLDFLTGTETAPLVRGTGLFDHVFEFERVGNPLARSLELLRVTRRLPRYELVLDLQRNWVTRLIRKACVPDAWSEFDRFGNDSAFRKINRATAQAGLGTLNPPFSISVKTSLQYRAMEILGNAGWDASSPLVILNPAGLFQSRSWDIQNYIALGRKLSEYSEIRFLFLGTARNSGKAEVIAKALGARAINLVAKTTLDEAFAILQKASLTISEDSGLMHMSWVSGIPTIALFGSTNFVWASPHGDHTVSLHSGDLPCGACMQPTCKFGDTHCLSRYSPELIAEYAISLMKRNPSIASTL